MPTTPPVIFTCGHSTRAFDELTQLLYGQGITLVVDVRSVPKSRYQPWFNQAYLERHLPMRYLWRGDVLGDKALAAVAPDAFGAAIEEVAAFVETECVCILCSERDPGPSRWRKTGCHRWHSIAPALQAKGIEVLHL